MHKLADLISARELKEIYRRMVSHWPNPNQLVPGSVEPITLSFAQTCPPSLVTFTDQMMYLDQATYLPGDILTKVDRAAMAVGLETRMPFLDHRVIEFSWSLPISMKIDRGETKRILRKVLYKHVPKPLVDRPKSGFAVPMDTWLRSALREWAEDLLDEARIHREGFLDPAPIRQRWREHVQGVRNWSQSLWNVLMFQAWLERQRSASD